MNDRRGKPELAEYEYRSDLEAQTPQAMSAMRDSVALRWPALTAKRSSARVAGYLGGINRLDEAIGD
jgi:hypothetical protein